MKYTYAKNYMAWYGIKHAAPVQVPDQVAADQKAFDGKSFPVMDNRGRMVRAYLRGDLYGLHTTGTGEMVVTSRPLRQN